MTMSSKAGTNFAWKILNSIQNDNTPRNRRYQSERTKSLCNRNPIDSLKSFCFPKRESPNQGKNFTFDKLDTTTVSVDLDDFS